MILWDNYMAILNLNMKVGLNMSSKTLSFLFCLSLLTPAAFAKIAVKGDKVFIESKGERTPLMMVNSMIKKKEISKLKLYGSGAANVISFAKKGEDEKLYSVDRNGFIYAIEPFSNYEVNQVDSDGLVQFKEVPGKSYRITSKGFFIN
jgi:hypothetical protein